MKELKNKVALVTGGANGIGRALCEIFSEQGMKIVMADIERAELEKTAAEFEADGVDLLPVVTDVSKADEVESLAQAAIRHFGTIDIACNNAGVFTGGLSWEVPHDDWKWLIDVNLWGVIHGIRSFIPIMQSQGTQGHIVNTASMAGLTACPFVSTYHMTKHAVVALSECVYHELQLTGSQIGLSVLCPEVVTTTIAGCDRHRPEHLDGPVQTPEREQVFESVVQGMKTAPQPREIAERVLDAVQQNRFYILSQDDWLRVAKLRFEDIQSGRNPTFSPPIPES